MNETNKKIRMKEKEDLLYDGKEERYCTVAESLEQSFKQMKLMREGKLPKKTWREYMEKWIKKLRRS